MFARLRRQIDLTADPVLIELLREFSQYPSPMSKNPNDTFALERAVAIPFRVTISLGLLSFFTTSTIFGTPVDVTLSELAVECFYPADTATAEIVRKAAGIRDVSRLTKASSASQIAS